MGGGCGGAQMLGAGKKCLTVGTEASGRESTEVLSANICGTMHADTPQMCAYVCARSSKEPKCMRGSSQDEMSVIQCSVLDPGELLTGQDAILDFSLLCAAAHE